MTQHGAAANLAKVFQAMVSPTGLAIAGITAAITALVIVMNNMQKATKEAFSNIGKGASDFVTGISTAQSHLEAFNSELFVSSEEQIELEKQMEEVQKGITDICKTAADERRGYTQSEIKQLDEYFEKLRALNQRELEIQQNIAEAITQQAVQNAKTFEGSLTEYKTQSQEWIKTAEEQKEKTIALINNQTIEEVALLNTRYTTEAERQTEAYKNEYRRIEEQKQERITAANDEMARINEAYANGYIERIKNEETFYNELKEANDKAQNEVSRHYSKLEEIEEKDRITTSQKVDQKISENTRYQEELKKIWNKLYEDMDSSQEEQLGVWLAMVAQTELYGGEIDDETKQIADSVIDSFNKMPKGTQEAMKNAMQPMLTEMQNKEPVLYSKATSIAEGILSRLKKAFDIHSPSKETKKIFQNVMRGAEEGLEAEKVNLNREIDQLSSELKYRLASLDPAMRNMDGLIIDRNKTIYTTPNIVFNVQELDKQRLEQCFNYVNLKFGSQY